jgi:hypothetical protein
MLSRYDVTRHLSGPSTGSLATGAALHMPQPRTQSGYFFFFY